MHVVSDESGSDDSDSDDILPDLGACSSDDDDDDDELREALIRAPNQDPDWQDKDPRDVRKVVKTECKLMFERL